MKQILVFIISVLLFISCKKNNVSRVDDNNNNNVTNPTDSNNTNQPTPVQTSIRLFNSKNNANQSLQFRYGTDYFTRMYNYYYSFDHMTADKYLTPLKIDYYLWDQNSPEDNLYKLFPASDAVMSYVNVAPMATQSIGSLFSSASAGTFPLPGNNGEISFPANSWGPASTVPTEIKGWYSNPEMDDYAVSLPVNLTVDGSNHKKFLKSYGLCYFAFWCTDNTQNQQDIEPNADVRLRLPILADMQAGAPDSIAAWTIDPSSHLWVQNGYATKTGNLYEKRVTKKGYWNFAIPVDGNYIKLKLRSDSSSTLTNNSIVIKDDTNKQVAEGITDANGDALFFVPSNTNLTTYTPAITNGFVLTRNIGSFNAYNEVPLSFPINTAGMTSVFGKVFDCNGTALQNGYMKFMVPNIYFPVYPYSGYTEYNIPFTNGNFVSSFWNNGALYSIVKIYDMQGNIIGDSTKISVPGSNQNVANSGKQFNYNFYSCWNSTKLYINYQVDGIKYSLTDDATSPSCFLLETTPSVSATQISATHNNLGVTFWYTPGSIVYDITVNGVTYQNDNSGLGYHNYTRDDGFPGGYYEGMFNLYCKDAANVMHNITGNYRLKRN